MNWSNLPNNKCPKCNKNLKAHSVFLIGCEDSKCDFVISIDKFKGLSIKIKEDQNNRSSGYTDFSDEPNCAECGEEKREGYEHFEFCYDCHQDQEN
jgi:hypothetical protein